MVLLEEWEPVVEVCSQLKREIVCDFVGLALQNESGLDVRWHFAIGNLNDKYKRITVRFGKGIAGKVIMTGSSMMIEDFPNGIQGKPTEHPIMLAEKLISSYAFPIFLGGAAKGVLFVGERLKRSYNEMEQQQVRKTALLLEEVLKVR